MTPLSLIDDTSAVADDEILYRRVHWDHIGGNKPLLAGQVAPLSGNAFRDFDAAKAATYGFAGPCMSVAVASILQNCGKDLTELLTGWGSNYGIARFRAGDARTLVRHDGSPCSQGVMLAPTEPEPWHAVVFDLGGERNKQVAKRLALIAEWAIPLVYMTEI